jgi:hypothetical protein
MDVKIIIKSLGGVSKVAELCEVTPDAIYQWQFVHRIPKVRLKLLRALLPDAEIWRQIDAQKDAEDNHVETPL